MSTLLDDMTDQPIRTSDHTIHTSPQPQPQQKDLDMTTTLIPPADNTPTTPSTVPAETQAPARARVTFGRIVSSEWFKFRTVRSNLAAIGGAAVAAVAFGAIFSSLAGSDEGPSRLADSALSLSLGGFQLSQLIIAILGVALVAGEYQSGLIRTWFGAAPDRIRVLLAKVTVFGGLVFAVSLGAAITAFSVGQRLLPDGWEALSLGSDGVWQALFGTALYASAIGVIGIGLGFLLRSTAAGAGAVVTTLMIAPLMVGLLPASIGDPIAKILPSNAGSAIQGVESTTELLSSTWGLAVLAGWVVVIIGAAAVSLKRRDA